MAHITTTHWKHTWLLRSLTALEFLLLTTLLGLIGYNNPDTFTTKLRADGHLNNFNSSPTSTASTPYVWSSSLTKYNLTLTVTSFLLLVAQTALHILRLWPPAAAAALKCALLAAWSASVRAQAGADNTDPRRPSPAPWFLRVASCASAYYRADRPYCHIARATFGVAVVLLACYAAVVALAVVSVVAAGGARGKVLEGEGGDLELQVGGR